MPVVLSTLIAYSPATVTTGTVISSTVENNFRSSASGLTALVNNLLTAATDQQQSRASSSAPSDKPAGAWWFDSTNLIMQYYEVASGTLRTVVTRDKTETLTNKTLTSPTLTTPNMTTNPLTMTGAAVVTTPSAGFGALATLATDGFSVAKSAPYFINEAGYRVEFGGGAAKNASAVAVDLASYVSATGTAGADATAQTVKSITIKGGSLNAVGRGIRISFSVKNSTGTSILLTLSLNGVTIETWTMITNSATFNTNDSLKVLYVDGTHVNTEATTIRNAGNAFFGNVGNQQNLAGFVHSGDQTLALAQANAAGTHLTVFSLIVEQLG